MLFARENQSALTMKLFSFLTFELSLLKAEDTIVFVCLIIKMEQSNVQPR
jgi:hypothetical protein